MAVDLTYLAEPWQMEQLARLYQHRPDLVSNALHRLLEEDAELRWAVVVGAYLDRQISLGKAAELLGDGEHALRERFLDRGIRLRVGPADLSEAQAEVAVARCWLDRTTS